MPYSLNLIDPTCAMRQCIPRHRADGRVDYRELGYVQTVCAGMIIAEIVPTPPGRQGADDPARLLGEGCVLDPERPDQVRATRDGHLEWDDSRLSVPDFLLVDEDVTYHVGNIRYPGDMTVNGLVRQGFHLHARALRVSGLLEGAHVRCRTLDAAGGIKAGGEGDIRATDGVHASFVENARLSSGGDMVVAESAMHNYLLAGGTLFVGDRLVGGRATARTRIEVRGRLGGGLSTLTRVQVGSDPFLVDTLRRINARLQHAEDIMLACTRLAGRGGMIGRNATARAERYASALRRLNDCKNDLLRRIADTTSLSACSVAVPGEVRPGVQVRMGLQVLKIQDFLSDVRFEWHGGEIHTLQPAIKKT
ncbi:FapA family protein [Nitratidesulfovibrio termitidis]|uniref:FapA family protein n=1 Tax=Nitratidesulfovibrio termitidis TaxID=42252 RepID=UPI0003FB99F9|nr:FapA family protein [Nitratidesulfovibrio termitidis]